LKGNDGKDQFYGPFEGGLKMTDWVNEPKRAIRGPFRKNFFKADWIGEMKVFRFSCEKTKAKGEGGRDGMA
jgi:hypothetical protein